MLAFNFKLDGFKKVYNRYSIFYPRKIRTNIDKQLTEVGLLVQKTARKYAPSDEGDLERNILFKTGKDYVKIYVPANSRAGAYAFKMHYDNYDKGPGTKAKGSKAGRLYIKRGIQDNRSKIIFKMEKAFDGVAD